jgi:hypothetical protein
MYSNSIIDFSRAKLIIVYPGGAGGSWLDNLIYKLENKMFIYYGSYIHTNFHSIDRSENLCVTHNCTIEDAIYFNGIYKFNFYLNIIKKHYLLDTTFLNSTFTEQIDKLSDQASLLIGFTNRVDLNYFDLWSDPDKFINELFNILDQHNLQYFKEKDICYNSIEQYKKTTVDPLLYLNNYDELVWLGWVCGIVKSKKIPLSFEIASTNSVSELANKLIINYDIFSNLTNQLTMLYDN